MEHREETTTLISGDKVAGTVVYNAIGERLCEIHDVMLDKQSGRVAYAVMSFGGFLCIGEKYHPLPWSALTYDTDQGGYVVNVSREHTRRPLSRRRYCLARQSRDLTVPTGMSNAVAASS
jgi:hypothetical protein